MNVAGRRSLIKKQEIFSLLFSSLENEPCCASQVLYCGVILPSLKLYTANKNQITHLKASNKTKTTNTGKKITDHEDNTNSKQHSFEILTKKKEYREKQGKP